MDCWGNHDVIVCGPSHPRKDRKKTRTRMPHQTIRANMAETTEDAKQEDANRAAAREAGIADTTVDWTVREGTDAELRINPRATLRVIRSRLDEIELLLMAGKQFAKGPAGPMADQRLRDLLRHDFLVWVDALSYECGLITGDRDRRHATGERGADDE